VARRVVGTTKEFPAGSRRIVDVDGIAIGVFNVAGTFYAVLNRCPHQGAPLCAGVVSSSLESSEPGEYVVAGRHPVLRCPWHGWEFDLSTGRSWWDPAKSRVRVYSVHTEAAATFPVWVEGEVVVLDTATKRGADS
jgi:nitrite reductase/ring-hydroxylating ferredoxin subunit